MLDLRAFPDFWRKFKSIVKYRKIPIFYIYTSDYLLGLAETKKHSNADLADLRLSDEMIDLLKSGRIDTALLCELAAPPDCPKNRTVEKLCAAEG